MFVTPRLRDVRTLLRWPARSCLLVLRGLSAQPTHLCGGPISAGWNDQPRWHGKKRYTKRRRAPSVRLARPSPKANDRDSSARVCHDAARNNPRAADRRRHEHRARRPLRVGQVVQLALHGLETGQLPGHAF
jgi:hypothetical protein